MKIYRIHAELKFQLQLFHWLPIGYVINLLYVIVYLYLEYKLMICSNITGSVTVDSHGNQRVNE